MKLTWIELSEEDKLLYKSYCDSKYGESFTKYGESFTKLPSGEPLYLDGDDNMYRYEDVVKVFIRDNRSKKLEDIFLEN